MQLLLQHTNLSDTAQTFFMDVLQRCPQVFRPREIHWQLKLLSRFPADRDSFVAAVEQKSHELAQVLPFLSIAPVPPPRSTPLRLWANYGLPWPDPVGLLTQLYPAPAGTSHSAANWLASTWVGHLRKNGSSTWLLCRCI
ncbi:hypothetical protein EBU99_07670 [bacterium]|nr:hypothetical protein [bacterium]